MWVRRRGGIEEGVGEVRRGEGVVGTGWVKLSLAVAPFNANALGLWVRIFY